MLIQISGLAEGISTIIIEGSTEAMEFLDEMLSRGRQIDMFTMSISGLCTMLKIFHN